MSTVFRVENVEKGMIYMKILKKGGGGGVVEKKEEEETKSMPHAPVPKWTNIIGNKYMLTDSHKVEAFSLSNMYK